MFCCCTWGAPSHLLSLLSESYLLVVTGKVELTGCSRELTRWRLSSSQSNVNPICVDPDCPVKRSHSHTLHTLTVVSSYL